MARPDLPPTAWLTASRERVHRPLLAESRRRGAKTRRRKAVLRVLAAVGVSSPRRPAADGRLEPTTASGSSPETCHSKRDVAEIPSAAGRSACGRMPVLTRSSFLASQSRRNSLRAASDVGSQVVQSQQLRDSFGRPCVAAFLGARRPMRARATNLAPYGQIYWSGALARYGCTLTLSEGCTERSRCRSSRAVASNLSDASLLGRSGK